MPGASGSIRGETSNPFGTKIAVSDRPLAETALDRSHRLFCSATIVMCVGSAGSGHGAPVLQGSWSAPQAAKVFTHFFVKLIFMSMSKTAPALGPANPEIGASELKAVRDFLTSFRDGEPHPAGRSPRPFARPGERKSPAVSHGIARARFRSTTKVGD